MTAPVDAVELRDLAVDVATEAAAMLLERVDRSHTVDTKSSASDLVTEVDRAAEALIVDRIAARRPGDGFVGEEGTDHPGTSGVRWIIDPIDGTANFVYGHPGYGVSIAVEIDDRVVAGAVADPVHAQVFDAAAGHGARCNGRPVSVRATTDLSRAIVATGFSFRVPRRRRQAEMLVELLPAIADIRRMGSAAIDLCAVAIGRVDAYYEIALNEWDVAAGSLIAAEAGALVIRRDVPDPADPTRCVPLVIAAAPGIAGALDDALAAQGW